MELTYSSDFQAARKYLKGYTISQRSFILKAVQKILVLKQDGTEDEYITISSLVDLKEALSKINKLSAFSESATKLLDMLGTQSEIKTDIIDSWIKWQDDSTRYSISDL